MCRYLSASESDLTENFVSKKPTKTKKEYKNYKTTNVQFSKSAVENAKKTKKVNE